MFQFGPPQVGVGEVGPLQLGEAEVGLRQVGAEKKRARLMLLRS